MVSLYDPNAGNQNPTNPNPYQYDDNWWWNYNPYGNIGGYDPYSAPVTSWQDQIAQSGGTAPQNPDVDANGNPIFRTDVVGNAPPVETTGSDIGQLDPNLANYLASLSGGGTANFNVTGTDFMDPSYPFPGEYPVENYDPNPPPYKFETTTWDTPDPDDPIKRGDYKTYWDFPQTGGTETGDPFQPAKPNPPYVIGDSWPKIPPDIHGPTLTTPPRNPPTQPPPTQPPQQPGGKQQQQQPGVGKLLAALPMLAAFQGGTTTTPAPYAHLGPHTPVAPVFKPQGRGNPIPSIGQLLAGVK